MQVRRVASAVMIALFAACSGEGSTEPVDQPPADSTGVHATVDGTPWRAYLINGSAYAFDGGFAISGTGLSAGSPVNISINLGYIPGPGTYPLGVDPGDFSGGVGSIQFLQTGQQWITPFTGGSGALVIRSISPSRISGTFEYTATPVSFGPVRRVTNGVFSIPLSNPTNTAIDPTNVGSQLNGTIGAAPFSAGNITRRGVGALATSSLVLTASDTTYRLEVDVSGVSAAGTYVLGTGVARTVTVSSLTGSAKRWGGSNATTSGQLVVSEMTTRAVKGTLTATVAPTVGTSGPAIDVSITFNVRLW